MVWVQDLENNHVIEDYSKNVFLNQFSVLSVIF